MLPCFKLLLFKLFNAVRNICWKKQMIIFIAMSLTHISVIKFTFNKSLTCASWKTTYYTALTKEKVFDSCLIIENCFTVCVQGVAVILSPLCLMPHSKQNSLTARVMTEFTRFVWNYKHVWRNRRISFWGNFCVKSTLREINFAARTSKSRTSRKKTYMYRYKFSEFFFLLDTKLLTKVLSNEPR